MKMTAAKVILKQTALSTLITAIAWPYGLVRAKNMIDEPWTLTIERVDLEELNLHGIYWKVRQGIAQ